MTGVFCLLPGRRLGSRILVLGGTGSGAVGFMLLRSTYLPDNQSFGPEWEQK
jgi:hypothetical protein